MKGVLTGLKIDNQGSADRTVTITDVFTPDASEGVSSPSEQTITRLQVTVGAGLTANVPKEELEDCKFLGVAKATGDAIDASCVIIAIYHLE
ncbi:MAG: hypothetical protein JRD89_10165 [Deltaproteobacteria bacterium]|nr:hypothetical protein [Deltaproteobacteria bacterium]